MKTNDCERENRGTTFFSCLLSTAFPRPPRVSGLRAVPPNALEAALTLEEPLRKVEIQVKEGEDREEYLLVKEINGESVSLFGLASSLTKGLANYLVTFLRGRSIGQPF